MFSVCRKDGSARGLDEGERKRTSGASAYAFEQNRLASRVGLLENFSHLDDVPEAVTEVVDVAAFVALLRDEVRS